MVSNHSILVIEYTVVMIVIIVIELPYNTHVSVDFTSSKKVKLLGT